MKILFVTGTGTDVGKTVFTGLLLHHLIVQGVRAVAFKPVCSGERSDAEFLWKVMGKSISLDSVNPYHFKKPVAPLVAARSEGKRVGLVDVTTHLELLGQDFDIVLVEGAGGLMSPMGEGFCGLDLAVELGAEVILVGKNQLGIINEMRMAFSALKTRRRGKVSLVLMSNEEEDESVESNAGVLRELGLGDVLQVPYFEGFRANERAVKKNYKEFKKVLAAWGKFAKLVASSAKADDKK
ncbi:MAG: dethiobiotin synthase [Verrucomicrobiales bacterium]|nr:dethiobiotin synthase [Verrucomicrobiales bacterium]